ncbi:hypothetical protein FQA39_LY03103 [Lamprigera yunnana]|nr:hypothetical protein FQA39_LY03103 [Lamprigera yunnana]
MTDEEIISLSDSDSVHTMMVLQVPLKHPQKPLFKPGNSKLPQFDNGVVSISSKSSQRCPVTWSNSPQKDRLKYLHSDSFLSPSPKTKVSRWLFNNYNINTNHSPIHGEPLYPDNKSSILIRQDYIKPAIKASLPQSLTSLNSRKNSDVSNTLNNNFSECAEKQALESPKTDKCNCEEIKNNEEMRVVESELIALPVNLEVPNKIELCEYLKLMNMNPRDGKIMGMKQNRRSSRVKNLAIMSEKKALERELNSDAQDYLKKKVVMTNSIDQDIKSCCESGCSKVSKESSKRTNGTNPSISVQMGKIKRNTPSHKTSETESKIRSVLEMHDHFENCDAPIESLQVPEVSTTSMSKASHKKRRNRESDKFCDMQETTNDSGVKMDDTGSSKSMIITRRSFAQLNVKPKYANFTNSIDQQRDIKDKILNHLSQIPSTDFEDSFRKHITEKDINESTTKKVSGAMHNLKPKKADMKLKNVNFSTKKERNHKNRVVPFTRKFKKSNIRQKMHEKLKSRRILKVNRFKQISLKLKKTKLFGTRRDLIKLRSRGRLKEVEIKSVLLNCKRKKRKKKKLVVKATQVSPKKQEKQYVTVDLIQNRAGTADLIHDEQDDIDIQQPQLHASPLTILKMGSEIDLLQDLTLEHRNALLQSMKFLLVKPQEQKLDDIVPQQKINHSSENVIDVEATGKVCKTIETIENCDTACPFPKSSLVEQQPTLLTELIRPCPEDLEVHKLMNSTYLKDQQKSNSNDITSLLQNALSAVLQEQWRCTLSSKSGATTTSSLQTVESMPILSPVINDVNVSKAPNNGLVNEAVIERNSAVQGTITISEDESSNNGENQSEVVDISQIKHVEIECTSFAEDNENYIKSLHQYLSQPRKKPKEKNDSVSNQDWDERFDTEQSQKGERKTMQSYAIHLSFCNGAITNAYYLDFNLVIVQEFLISFWNQSSLGNVLGVQDMWVPKGDIKRLVLGNGCAHKESSESVMVLDNSIAYVELWTKEHKSDKRERPVADIFVTIYLRLNGTGPDKKVLQLENIHGYANDVQCIVLRNSPYIIVSWNTINDQLTSTVVHRYQLASDYKRSVNDHIRISVEKYGYDDIDNDNEIDSDSLIMGCGEDKITLWHVDHGHIVATVDLMAITRQPRTLWAKADRGFIFTLHNFNDGNLYLIATNSFDYSWKQLQMYKQGSEYENLLGICIENGLVIAFYDSRILCWRAKSGELIIDSPCDGSMFLPFGRHIVIIVENQVHVRHVLEYLVTIDS